MCMGMEFWSCDLRPWGHDLDLGNHVNAPVPKVLIPMWSVCACGLPKGLRCVWAWNVGPVTFDLGATTLNLGSSGLFCVCGIDANMAICACGLPMRDRCI